MPLAPTVGEKTLEVRLLPMAEDLMGLAGGPATDGRPGPQHADQPHGHEHFVGDAQ